MNKESLEKVSEEFIQRLSVLQNINEIDKLEIMLLINNMFQSVDEYEHCRKAMQQSYQKRIGGHKNGKNYRNH